MTWRQVFELRVMTLQVRAHPSGPVAEAFAARIQAREAESLSPLAARSYPADRREPAEPCGLRTPFQRDRDRIVHCKSVPPPEAQDPGVRRPRGRPLPHAPDPHARGHRRSRARSPARCASTRTSSRRSGSATTSATRPSATSARTILDRCCASASGASSATTSTRCGSSTALERTCNLTDPRSATGSCCHSGRRRPPATLEGRIVRIVDRVAYLNHDIDDALRAGVLEPRRCRPRRSPALGANGSERIDALVHDLVEHSERAGDIVQGDEAGGGDGRAARLHVRARLPGRGGAARAREDRARGRGSCSTIFCDRARRLAAAETAADADLARSRDRLHRGHDRPLRASAPSRSSASRGRSAL